ncbi:MAG: SH3 domain-containing protein [Anaerolineaceae bacterium]|nr:SH3 domain-containing protein [Anaerolineaceae bacterium]MCB9100221.1 SH3 domain-containing protein [Anaerolineales bacterium]
MKLILVWTSLIMALSLTACGGAPPTPEPLPPTEAVASVLTEPDQATQEAEQVAAPTPTDESIQPAEPTATNTPVSTPTLEPTATPVPATPTPSPIPDPMIKVDEALGNQVNVRSGPGTVYPVVTQFAPGQEAMVLGRNEDGSWWQISLPEAATGWIFGELVTFIGDDGSIAVAEAPPPPPTATPAPEAVAEANPEEAPAGTEGAEEVNDNESLSPEQLEDQLRCGKDFCVTYQDMLPIWENGGCVGNHSIYITVLQGPPPGVPMDGVVIGDTYNNVEVASGSHGPGHTEITLWNNSMTLYAKRHIDGTPYTSEESFNFTAADELIPAEVLAAKGYCDGSVETCRWAQNHNQVCRGHYSWRVTFHKFD